MEIDKVTCLCLVDREQEWSQLEEQIKQRGWNYERFLAGSSMYATSYKLDWEDVDDPDVSKWGYGREGYKHHHWNAFQCHKEMIRRAIAENRRNLLILEDDAYITDRFDSVFSVIPDDLTYDILYLGWWVGDETDSFNLKCEEDYRNSGITTLYKAKQVGGLHGILINKSTFNLISSLPPNNPIDYQLNFFHGKIKSYFISPKIIHTKSIYSICEGYIINRKSL